MNHNENAIIGIDIGSSKISALVCEIDEQNELHIKGQGSSISSGILRGKITDQQELERAIARAIQRAEQMANIHASKTVINLPFYGFEFVKSLGLITSQEEAGQISSSDQQMAIENAKKSIALHKKKIMHVIPQCYKVENIEVQNPVGVFGRRLEVQTLLINTDTENLLSIAKMMKHFNLHILGIVYDPLSLSQVYLTDEDRQNGTVLIDIGGRFTKFNFFQSNRLEFTSIIPIGGETITADIAYCLNVTIPEAERLKIQYGTLDISQINPQTMIQITTKEEGRKEIPLQLLSEIIIARVAELLKLIQKDANPILQKSYPIKLAGQSTKLKGLKDYIEQNFQSPVSIQIPASPYSNIDHISYTSALGLLVYALKQKVINYTMISTDNPLSKCMYWFKKYFI